LSAATVAYGAGDIVSTSSDLAEWVRDLYGGDVVSADSLAQMTDWHQYAQEAYGLGTRARKIGAHQAFGHTGSLRGFDAAMWYAPDIDTSFVTLTNRGRIDANPIIDALAAVALPLAEAYTAT
jgi:D-alanyl-D-alanine carboxypeptidase